MLHALLLTETFEDLTARASPGRAPRAGGGANAIFLPQFTAALPLFMRARAMVRRLNTHHAPAGASSGKGTS